MRRGLVVALMFGVVLAGTVGAGAAHAKPRKPTAIRVLSNRADLISAGNALVEVRLPARARRWKVKLRLGRRDVTRAFKFRSGRRLRGVVTGLRRGRNVLEARLPDGWGARITITNHRNGGPVFSGPQIQPWKCQRTAKDKQCNQPVEYSYLYRSSDPSRPGLQPYDPKDPPSDVATATTDDGVRVPFIVRQELGYQDRDQYKILTLFQPGKPWDRWRPQRQWNHKLLIPHGGGCGASYGAGDAPLDDFSGTLPSAPGYTHTYVEALGRGFAVMSTALDNNGHNCNIAVQAESLIMAKERLIERYGDVRYTIGTGCSGGALVQQQVANAYPGGVYNGLIVTCAYPDTLTPGAQFADYHLLRLYFEDPSRWGPGVAWTPTQWAAVDGHVTHLNAVTADEGLFKEAINPSHHCNGVSDAERYDPQTNPGGVRCSVIDYMINVLGPRPASAWSPIERRLGRGFAGTPLGNAGIQYGLGALERGQITPAQFADLNAKIGGLGVSLELTPERIAGDDGALRNAYRSGAINEANHLDTVAIIDHAGPEPGVAHDYSHTWWMRHRLRREHGHYRNHVLWFGQTPFIGDPRWPIEAFVAMDRWLRAIERDRSRRPLARKVLADKPSDVRDRCEEAPGVGLADQVCSRPEAQTHYGTPRTVAGGDVASDANKCQLKPLRREDYAVKLGDAQWRQLQAAFPAGVCDWSKPGVGQQDTVAWQTYQDRRGRVVYGGRALGRAPRSEPFGCLSPRASIGARNIGRVNLGLSRRRLLRRVPGPRRKARRSWRWCVGGSRGAVSAAFSPEGRVALVVTTARRHGNRRLRPGSPAGALARAYPRRRRVARGLYRATPASPRLIGVRRGRVRFIGVASPRLIRDRGSLSTYLRLAGL